MKQEQARVDATGTKWKPPLGMVNGFIGGAQRGRQRFWMCLVDGKDTPKHRHDTLEEAQSEAERLAKLTGKEVFVLEASTFVRYIPPTIPLEMEWHETNMGAQELPSR